ncbi:hypothetical protein KFQ04_28725 (plasmid) [Pseudomonas synxantha]|nr:hypothetical protein KFQ04_28725 [Pseudomonas synxantha]
MKKLLFVVTSIVMVAGIIYTAAGSKEQPNNLVKKIQNNYWLEWEILVVEWVNL